MARKVQLLIAFAAACAVSLLVGYSVGKRSIPTLPYHIGSMKHRCPGVRDPLDPYTTFEESTGFYVTINCGTSTRTVQVFYYESDEED